MNIKKIVVMSGALLAGFSIITNVDAGTTSSVRSSSSSVSRSTSSVSRSTSSAMRSSAYSTSRSASTSASRSISRGTASISRNYGSRAASQVTNTTRVTQRMNITSRNHFSSSARDPYSSRYHSYYNSGMSPWFYFWLFSGTWNTQQRQQASVMGITQEDAQNLKENSKHISLGSGDDAKTVIVTPTQYDAVHKGDKVKVSDDGFFVNGKKVK